MNLEAELLKQFPEPLVVYDLEKNIVYSSRQFDRLSNKYSNADSPEDDVFQFIEDNISKGIDHLLSMKGDCYITTAQHNEIHFEIKFRELVVNDAKYGIAVLVRDISRLKNTEISLRKSEELFRIAFEKNPIGMIYAENPGQPIINCNQRFCDMMKMTKEEILQKTMGALTHPQDLKKDRETFLQALTKGEDYVYRPNKRLISKEGEIILSETHATLIYDDKGKYDYSFALIYDVTEQRENQRKYIEVKTKLIQSEKLASLGQITAGIAHEINNPVNFIYNGVTNLRTLISKCMEQDAPDRDIIFQDIQQMLAAIDDGAQRTTEIVKSLRMFTKEDVSSKSRFNVIDGLESTLLLLGHRIKNRIRIEKDFASEKIMLNCYPSQLNQVFMNILSNAVEAIEGNGVINIVIKENQHDVIFEIKDSGAGIPPDLYLKVFEPFYSTKGAQNGTGLGLSISHTIIEKHNGSIGIRANEPKGTIITVRIPTD